MMSKNFAVLRGVTARDLLALLLLLGVSVPLLAQQPAPPPKQEEKPKQAEKKPKKVWTNEDLSSLKQQGSVSVVGRESSEPKAESKPAGKQPGSKAIPLPVDPVEKFRRELAKKQAKAGPPPVDPVEKFRRELAKKQAEELKKQQEDLKKITEETQKRMEEQKKKPPVLPPTKRP